MVNLLDMKYRDVLANLCFHDRIQDSRKQFLAAPNDKIKVLPRKQCSWAKVN